MDHWVILPEYAWRAVASHCVNLQGLVETTKGGSEGKPENRKKGKYPKQVPWLDGVKDVMKRPFSAIDIIDYSPTTTITYPDDLERPRLAKEHILAGTKVLVPYDPNPTWGKRARVAIERKGYYVSDSFWVIAPTSMAQRLHITCEVLAAVLSWDVSNAWIVEHLKSPAIPKRAINTIPFPKDLSEEDCKNLTQAVLQLEKAAHANQPEPEEANQTIDVILKAAYRLDEVTFERLRQVKEWDRKPQITLDPQPDPGKANWSLSGSVDSIDAEQGTITLWMEGFDELQTVRIVPSMPGWMLRPDAAFDTKIPRAYVRKDGIDPDSIDWGTFQPHPYTYLSEEELLDELFERLRRDEADRVR